MSDSAAHCKTLTEKKILFGAFNQCSHPASLSFCFVRQVAVDFTNISAILKSPHSSPNSAHHIGVGLAVFLSWPGCRRVVKKMGRKGGQEDRWSPLSPAGSKKRERRVCWVIHRLTLSFPGFRPSSFVCSLNPLITKSFLVQCWCLLGNCQTPLVLGHCVCFCPLPFSKHLQRSSAGFCYFRWCPACFTFVLDCFDDVPAA